MEKRFLIALVLSLIVLFGWQWAFADKPSETPTPKPAASATEKPVVAAPAKPSVPRLPPDQLREEVLENDRLRLVFSSAGGVLARVELKDYKSGSSATNGSLLLMAAPTDGTGALELNEARQADLGAGTYWNLSRSADGRSVSMERSVTRPGGTMVLRKEISLPVGDCRHATVRFSIEGRGEANTVFAPELSLTVTRGVFQESGGSAMSPARSGLRNVDKELRIVAAQEVREETQGLKIVLGGERRLAADLSNYFGAVLLLNNFQGPVEAVVRAVPAEDRGDGGAADERTSTSIDFGARVECGKPAVAYEALLYLGPLDAKIVAADFGSGQAEDAAAITSIYTDQLGWARVVGHAVLWMLDVCYGLCGNWGWAIVLLTLCVRLILFPVNRRSQDAMARHQEAMARLKPKLDALRKLHEKDGRAFATEQMKLMRSEKVKLVPLGGCLPMLLQIPIFFGLFAALRASIDLRQAAWLWVPDLSQPDHMIRFDDPVSNPLSLCGLIPGCGSCVGGAPALTGLHLLPILMTIAWFLNSYLMPKPATSDPQMEQQRKMMLFMPILFGFMMYGYAAGLSLYWLVSSTIGIIEGRIIRTLRAKAG